MNHKKILTILLILSILGLISGYIILDPDKFGICDTGDRACMSKFPVFKLGEPLVLGMPFLGVVTFILLFLRREVFTSWWHFAVWWIPLSIILIAVSPASSGGGFGLDIGFDKELTTWWMAGLFFLISLIIIIVKSIRLRRQGS